MDFFVIYKITNNINNKIYIGKHIGVVPLLTLKSKRDIECLETFTRRFEAFEKMMSNNGFYPVKSMLERCWLDDNYGYDDIWSYA